MLIDPDHVPIASVGVAVGTFAGVATVSCGVGDA